MDYPIIIRSIFEGISLSPARRVAAIAAFATSVASIIWAIFGPDGTAVPLSIAYHGQTVRDLPLRIEMSGDYLVMLNVPHKEGKGLDDPVPYAIESRAIHQGKEIGSAYKSVWAGDSDSYYAYYRFVALKGDTVLLDVKPGASFGKYNSYHIRLVVIRSQWDYAANWFRKIGWAAFGLFMLFCTRLLVRCMPRHP